MSDVQLFMLVFIVTWCWMAYELVEIRRDFKAMIQELDLVRRILIDAKDSLENIAESVKTLEESADAKAKWAAESQRAMTEALQKRK